jgi:hypothetical protein
MRSRKNYCSVSPQEVYDRAAAIVQAHVQIQDHGHKCTSRVLLNILFFAAARITSIFAACRNLADAPTDQAVGYALIAMLPEADLLQQRINAALRADLPKALRRKPQYLAIDLTLIPYHGQPFRNENEIYRSQPKNGTSHFHAYATCYVVRKGYRFTIAMMPVPKGESMAVVVRELIRKAAQAGVKCRVLLLDRGFYSVQVIRYLQCAKVPFLMPVVVRGKKGTKDVPAGGTRVFAQWKKSGWGQHTIRTSKETGYGRSATVGICVACSNYRGRWNRKGRRTFVYAYWGFSPSNPHWVFQTYRKRFGIETSYRQMNEARIRTCTRNPLLRMFYFGFALILRNAWVWFHLVRLSVRCGRGIELHLERLRFRDMLLFLQRVVEIQLGIPLDQRMKLIISQILTDQSCP